MSFEKILYKLRDAWRQDIRQSLGGLPGYYWGEVTAAGEVLLDAVAPGAAPVPVDDLIGAAIGDRVLLVHVDGAFSVVGVAGRPRVGATADPRQVYVTDASGVQTTLPYHSNPQHNALVQRQGLDVLVPQTPAYINSAASQRHVELNGVPRFATVAARDTAFPSPVNGQVCYVTGNGYYVRDGGVWRTVLDDTGWQSLTMLNGWSGSQNPAVRRINSVIYFKGEVIGTNTGSSTPAFVLPIGFRPPTRTRTAIGYVSGSYSVMAIETDGSVWFSDPRSGTPGWMLGGVQFVAEI